MFSSGRERAVRVAGVHTGEYFLDGCQLSIEKEGLKIRSREIRGGRSDFAEITAFIERDRFRQSCQNRFPFTGGFRKRTLDTSVETAGSEQRRIDEFGSAGSRQDGHTACGRTIG